MMAPLRLLLSRPGGGQQRELIMLRLRDAWLRLQATFSVPWPAVELAGSAKAVAWGGWLVSSPELFSRYPQTFAPMALVAPPQVWGYAIAALGVLQCYATLTGLKRFRRVSCFLAFLGWTGLAVMYAQGDRQALGIPLLLAEALLALSSFLLLGIDYSRGRKYGGTA